MILLMIMVSALPNARNINQNKLSGEHFVIYTKALKTLYASDPDIDSISKNTPSGNNHRCL